MNNKGLAAPARIFTAFAAFAVCLMLAACPPPISDDIREDEPAVEGPPGLDGSSWAWSGVTLTFSAATVKMAGASGAYRYEYDREERTGSAESLGEFMVDEDFAKLRFATFMGTGPRDFDNLNAAIAGTKWRLGHALLSFSGTAARLHGIDYKYSFDAASKKGSVNAAYGKPGAFTLSQDETTLTFSAYRDSPNTVVFTKDTGEAPPPPPPEGSLVGSDWWWEGTSLHLDFISETLTLLWSVSGYYVPPIMFDYTRTNNGTAGRIYNGRNSVGTKYDLGDYSIQGNALSFVQYGPYPHGAVFYLQQ